MYLSLRVLLLRIASTQTSVKCELIWFSIDRLCKSSVNDSIPAHTVTRRNEKAARIAPMLERIRIDMQTHCSWMLVTKIGQALHLSSPKSAQSLETRCPTQLFVLPVRATSYSGMDRAATGIYWEMKKCLAIVISDSSPVS